MQKKSNKTLNSSYYSFTRSCIICYHCLILSLKKKKKGIYTKENLIFRYCKCANLDIMYLIIHRKADFRVSIISLIKLCRVQIEITFPLLTQMIFSTFQEQLKTSKHLGSPPNILLLLVVYTATAPFYTRLNISSSCFFSGQVTTPYYPFKNIQITFRTSYYFEEP